jgi:uncharacterized protein (TIGR00369 family)
MTSWGDPLDPVAGAQRMTEFFGPLVPGQLGCVFDHSAKDLVIGHIDVTESLIAGTGYLFAPAVIALADTCAAIGCGNNLPDDTSFTTIELKTNFLSSARLGERVACRCVPAHLGRQTPRLGCRGHQRVEGPGHGVVPLHPDPPATGVTRRRGGTRASPAKPGPAAAASG